MSAMLRLEGVSWGPTKTQRLINEICFDVAPGTITVLVGPNGAGKSSLLRCIYRYHQPLAGRILIDGQDIAKLKRRDVARRVAAVLQEQPSEFPLTVREVVNLGRIPFQAALGHNSSDNDAVVDKALAYVSLQHFSAKPYQQLSGGEKQRVALARALAQTPDLLVLDEPTNHLDIRHQLELLAILRTLGQTIVMSLHDLTMAANIADQIVVMRDGRVIAAGAPSDTLTPTVIRQAFDVQASRSMGPTTGTARSDMQFSFCIPDTEPVPQHDA